MNQENKIQSEIMRYLNLRKDINVHRNSQEMGSKPGRADLTMLYLGVHVDLEVKDPNGKPSVYQLREQEHVISCGGRYEFVTSLAEVKAIINEIKIQKS